MNMNESLLQSMAESTKATTEVKLTLSNSIKVLMRSDKSLFLIFFINLCSSVQFYILVTLIPLHFSTSHSFSDPLSGLVFGAFGVTIGFLSIYLSYEMSRISLKRGLSISFILGIIGFILMLFNDSTICLISIIFFHGISCSIAWPYAEYGVKEYSCESIRTLSSSCFFISNYMAGIATGFLLDYLWTSTNNELLVYVYACYFGISFLVIALISLKFCKSVHEINADAMDHEGIFTCKRFIRYCFLIFIMVLIRSSSFGHLDATLPKYLIRTQGNNAHFGIMLSVHSISMIFGLVTLTVLTYYFESFDLICMGALLGSLGCISAIFSNDIIAFFILVIFISIGESIWVPRLLDYTFKVAPEGKEGIYLAISNCPFYFGMILTGTESGWLFDWYCSKNGEESCYYIWLFVFASSFLIVVSLFALKRWIVEPALNHETNNEDTYKSLNN